MKLFSLAQLRSLSLSQSLLLGILSGLVAIHLTLSDRVTDTNFFTLSLLFWMGVLSLLWQRRDRLKLNSSLIPAAIGLLILVVVLLRSVTQPTTNFLNVSAFFSALGLALLASGFSGLKQFWRELVILFFLGVPKALLWPVLDISAFTAKFATFILWYAGFDVYREEFSVVLPGGAVNVNMGCSGFEGMFYLLGLAIMALLLYPLSGAKQFVVPGVAVILAFIVNGFRVALMALFANAQNQTALDYWHVGQGSLIFSFLSVTLFGCFYFLLLRQEPLSTEPETEESPL